MMTYAEAMADPKTAALEIRDAARASGHEAYLEKMLALITSAAVAKRLVRTSKVDRMRQACIVWLAENLDQETN